MRRPRCSTRAPVIRSSGCASASATRSTRTSPTAAAGVLAALAIGDQGAIERDDWDLFRNTGVAHLMSTSGLHVTMLAWLAGVPIGSLWRRSTAAMRRLPAASAARWGGLFAATAYAFFAGWGVPSQRTVWMLATVTLLQAGGLRWPWGLVLLCAAFVVTVLDPWAPTQAGFWLRAKSSSRCRSPSRCSCHRRRCRARAAATSSPPTSARAPPSSSARASTCCSSTAARSTRARATPASASSCRSCAAPRQGSARPARPQPSRQRPRRRRAHAARRHRRRLAGELARGRPPAARGGRDAHRCIAGQRWRWDGVDFVVLAPGADD